MIKYLPLVLSLATSMELNSLELFDVFGSDQAPMNVADNSLNHEPKYPKLEIKRLNISTISTKNLTKTSTDRTVNTWNNLPKARGVRQSVATTENSINTSRDTYDPWSALLEIGKPEANNVYYGKIRTRTDRTVNPWNSLPKARGVSQSVATTKNSINTSRDTYDPWSALLGIGEPEANNVYYGKIRTRTEETVNLDPLTTFLEVERLHANTTFTERSLNSSSDETFHLDPLQASLEVQKLHSNGLLFNMSTMKTNETVNQYPWNHLLDVARLSKTLASTENSTMTSMDKTVYPDSLNDLLEIEGLYLYNASTERSMKLNSSGILFHDPWNASLKVRNLSKSVISTENSMITRSNKTVYQDPLNALLELERLQANSAASETSMKSSGGGSILQDPENTQSEVERFSITVNSMKNSSDENIYQDQLNALRKVQTFHANGVFNRSSMKVRRDKMVIRNLLNSFLYLGRVSKSAATTKNSINAKIDKIVTEEPWDPLRELEKLKADSATTKNSMTTSSVDEFSQNPWSSLLKAGGLSKSVASTENLIATSSNINNQDSLNPLMELEKLRKIVDTTMNSTTSNITVKQESGNALPELAELNKGVGTTEHSIIPSNNITLGQKSTNISMEVKRQKPIGVAESLVLASTNQTATEAFLKVTVGYRRKRPTRTTTKSPLSPLNLPGCPEEELPRNFGAYEVPTQRDLVLQVRRTLLGSYRAYHRRALWVLKQMKEATKASWPRANSCYATSKVMYQRCVRRVSQRCEITGKSLVIALESLKEDVMDLIQGNMCNISAMNVDPIQLIRILAMEKVSLEFALPGFLRLLNACNVYCTRGPTKYANFSQKRIQKMTDQQLVVKHFLTKKSYAQLLKGAT